MKKVLIISYDYPPLNNIAARRYSQIVTYLQKFGWEPYILTTNSTGDLPTNLSEHNIFRCTSHPESKLGLNNNQKSLLPFSSLRKKLNIAFRSIDNSIIGWYLPVLKSDIMREIKHLEIDLVIASYRTPAALMLGRKIAADLEIPWIADFRDLGALYKDKYFIRPFILEYLDRKLEFSIIKSASAIITVSKALAVELESNYKKKSSVIYNGWIDNSDSDSDNAFESKLPYIYYAGRFYEHRMKAMFTLIDSIQNINILLVIRSLGPQDFNDKLIKYAETKGVLNKIIILPPASANIIDKEQRNSKLNLVIEDMDKTYKVQKGVLTGKLLQLLTYPPSIIAIARSDSEIGEVLSESNKGKLLSNKDEITSFINSILSEEISNCFSFESIQKYSKKMQAEKLAQLMDEIYIDNHSVFKKI